jgi:extradiol dioxygenase family protein
MTAFFHLAYHVRDLEQARQFYGTVLGCKEGRSAATWVDFDFHGHQLSLHLGAPFPCAATTRVREHLVPMPHFGLVLPMPEWRSLAEQLAGHGVAFLIEPCIRFAGLPGEQATMFFCDPSGNPLEIKSFADQKGIYAQ